MKLWIARDKDERLYLHEVCPYCDADSWYNIEDKYAKIPGWWFPEVTWENSPQQVELKLVVK